MDKLKKTFVLGWNWKLVFLLLAFTVPSLAYAQDFGGLEDLAIALGNIVQTLIPILVGIALLVFLWGVVKFIYNAGDEEARAQGKYVIFWGLLALFVIV